MNPTESVTQQKSVSAHGLAHSHKFGLQPQINVCVFSHAPVAFRPPPHVRVYRCEFKFCIHFVKKRYDIGTSSKLIFLYVIRYLTLIYGLISNSRYSNVAESDTKRKSILGLGSPHCEWTIRDRAKLNVRAQNVDRVHGTKTAAVLNSRHYFESLKQ